METGIPPTADRQSAPRKLENLRPISIPGFSASFLFPRAYEVNLCTPAVGFLVSLLSVSCYVLAGTRYSRVYLKPKEE
ncbi:MAG: hypothetical protein D6679_11315 [Candidatus Hydrogenedentota bacterium]|nr:MAG: hypothetical protein D6679_11315 [Candidatus Hydrogenedentota bacterium]